MTTRRLLALLLVVMAVTVAVARSRAAREDAALESFIDFTRLEDFADVRGIRIEDDVLVTLAGSEVLSRDIPKAVAEVEAVCLDSHRAPRSERS